MNDYQNKFLQAIRQSGQDFTGPIVADAKIHRFRTEGAKRGDKPGWYVLHVTDKLAWGSFGDWRLDWKAHWCSKQESSLSQADKLLIQQQKRELQLEMDKRYEAARIKAQQIWENAPGADPLHPYLVRKQVNPHGLRMIGNALIVPVTDEHDRIHSLQFITVDGRKCFLTDGKTRGHFLKMNTQNRDDKILICEGFATACSLLEATECPVVIAFNCWNLKPVTETIRRLYPKSDIVVCGDDDRQTSGNPGRTQAEIASQTVLCRLAMPKFASTEGKPTDFNDLACREGLEEVSRQIKAATMASEEEVIQTLSKLPKLKYEQIREEQAKKLGVRVTELDKLVAEEREKHDKNHSAIEPELEPWPEPVNGDELLSGLVSEIRRFLVLGPHQAEIIALFIVHSYAWRLNDYSPILVLSSPVPACGKSRTLDFIGAVAHKPLRSGNCTESVLFRLIEEREPTFLIDEFDSMNQEARSGVLNILKNGFHTSGKVQRVQGDRGQYKVLDFKSFCPKVLACIKISTLDRATSSRAINIRMERKSRKNNVERFRRYDGTDWQRKCLRWVHDHHDQIASLEPDLPEALGDREQDIWEPLIILADLAGGAWPGIARNAALELNSSRYADEPEDIGISLLQWIRQYFQSTQLDRVSSSELCNWLNDREDAGFKDWRNGKGIDARSLSRNLGGFNISPDSIRFDKGTLKGYHADYFQKAFETYIPSDDSQNIRNTGTTPDNKGDSSILASGTGGSCSGIEKVILTINNRACSGVPDKNGEMRKERVNNCGETLII